TMRLAFAARATAEHGETRVIWWDASSGAWQGPLAIELIGSEAPSPSLPFSPGRLGRLKRTIFPSTLWESGRSERAAVPSPSLLPDGAHVVLHTTYIAALADELRSRAARISVDAYDLIWRVHEMDADVATKAVASIRRLYARTVRPRELGGLKAADSVLTAGWGDKLDFEAAASRQATWAPTGLDVAPIARNPSDRLRVGLIGNFAHSATSESADRLLASPLATDASVDLVFAGLDSETWASANGVTALGKVASIADFYSQIDAMVVPVSNASGMKTKLAEAALAGCPVVTSPAGAAGYHPELQALLVVADDPSQLDAAAVRRATETMSGPELRDAFDRHLGLAAARASYMRGLGPSPVSG
ncbi:MAG: glycosyltransferase family 4 protein, partial [Solirubrobacteraceae bacterium]|nr:glycosyltransferase family 4 protein [Solirubrobacteraceae bacterium]